MSLTPPAPPTLPGLSTLTSYQALQSWLEGLRPGSEVAVSDIPEALHALSRKAFLMLQQVVTRTFFEQILFSAAVTHVQEAQKALNRPPAAPTVSSDRLGVEHVELKRPVPRPPSVERMERFTKPPLPRAQWQRLSETVSQLPQDTRDALIAAVYDHERVSSRLFDRALNRLTRRALRHALIHLLDPTRSLQKVAFDVISANNIRYYQGLYERIGEIVADLYMNGQVPTGYDGISMREALEKFSLTGMHQRLRKYFLSFLRHYPLDRALHRTILEYLHSELHAYLDAMQDLSWDAGVLYGAAPRSGGSGSHTQPAATPDLDPHRIRDPALEPAGAPTGEYDPPATHVLRPAGPPVKRPKPVVEAEPSHGMAGSPRFRPQALRMTMRPPGM